MMPLCRKRWSASHDEKALSFKLINRSTKSGPLSTVMRHGKYLFCNDYLNIYMWTGTCLCCWKYLLLTVLSLLDPAQQCPVKSLIFDFHQDCLCHLPELRHSLSRCISHLYNHDYWIWVAQLILGSCKSGSVFPRQHVQRHASFFGFFELIC